MRVAALVVFSAMALWGAVDGVVTNGTTGKPQPGVTVTLTELGSGMNTLGSVTTDAQGRFQFSQNTQASAPHLLQAVFGGVSYNHMVPPGQSLTGVQVQVFESSPKAPDAGVSQDMILLEPMAEQLVFNESVIFTNNGKVTLQDPNGELKLFVPPNVTGAVEVRITGPQGMPITRQAEKTNEPNVYAVRYPIKPGETRIDVSYTLPASDRYAGRILHGGGPVRLIAPKGVKLSAAGLTDLGPEPRTQATVYDLKAREFTVQIEGRGSLRESARAQQPEASGEDPSGGIQAAKPLLYKRIEWVVGFILAMLAVGFVLLYRTQTSEAGKRA